MYIRSSDTVYLHHGVWDLSAPEWIQAFVKTETVSLISFSSKCRDTQSGLPAKPFFVGDVRYSTKRCTCEGRNSSLHPDFYGLEWTETHVGNQLRRSTSCKVDCCLVFVEVVFSDKITVELLE